MVFKSMTDDLITIGIIGCGPRGLSALESLFSEASKHAKIVKALVFEMTDCPGAGPVYHINQTDSNWLNVSERDLAIPARTKSVCDHFSIPEFPDFQHWSGYTDSCHPDDATDEFPLRSKLGTYLKERYKSIAQVLISKGLMTLIHGEVNHADVIDDIVKIKVKGGDTFVMNEAVLCIGHQPIEPDEQLSEWIIGSRNYEGCTLFRQPYPLKRIIQSGKINSKSTCAIRGFGLAMIDVVRGLTGGRGGQFKIIDEGSRKMTYIESGKEPEEIVPFSLDGLPMAPKPLNKSIDSQYRPSEKQIEDYASSVRKSIQSSTTLQSPEFLMKAIAPIVSDIYLSLEDDGYPHTLLKEELNGVIMDWLKDEDFEHELILPKSVSPKSQMEKFIGMATGKATVSLDFCIGHVWRHCQPPMYKLLSFAPLSDELIADIVSLDERLKRYSYGPPVDSIQQILALVDAKIINLDYVSNPKIDLLSKGWKIKKNGKSLTAKTMMNSVLAAPEILKVVSPLPKRLLKESALKPIHDKLGIETRKDAIVKSDGKGTTTPIAVLGRLAKGTLIGVDAIAECFGNRSELWAKGVMERNI